MKENKLIEDIIKDKIKLIEAYMSEVEKTFQSTNIMAKALTEKSLEIAEEDIIKSDEFLDYQKEVFRDSLLKEEGNSVLKDLFSLIKCCSLIGVEFSEEIKNLIESKEYLKEAKESDKIFTLGKLGNLEERESGAYEKELQLFIENVKEEINAIGRNTNSN